MSLEDKITTFLSYLGTPSGTLFASYDHVKQLESTIQEQQSKIKFLEEQNTLYQTHISDWIQEQLQIAQQQRGTRGTDMSTLFTFITTQLAIAKTSFQKEYMERTKNLPTQETLTRIEQRLHRLEQGLKASTETPLNIRLGALESRLSMVEEQPPVQSTVSSIEYQPEEKKQDSIPLSLQTQLDELRESFIREIERVYTMSKAGGELGIPFLKVQQTVEALSRDVSILRQVDVRSLTESMNKQFLSQIRDDLLDVVDSKASKDMLVKSISDVHRLEGFVKEIQTGYYKFRRDLESFIQNFFIRLEKVRNELNLEQITIQGIQQFSDTAIISFQQTSLDIVKQIQKTDEMVQHITDVVHTLESSTQERFQCWITTQRTTLEEYAEQKQKQIQQQLQECLQTIKTTQSMIDETTIEKTVKTLKSFQDSIREQVQQRKDEYLESLTSIEEKYKSTAKQLSELQIAHSKLKTHVHRIKHIPQITSIQKEPTQVVPIQTPQKRSVLEYTSRTKCFYTALFGIEGQPIDTLSNPTPIPGWDYICFTNQTISYETPWTLINVESLFSSPVLDAKYYKWMSHKELEDYDIVCWVDAYIGPNQSMEHMLESWILQMLQSKTIIVHRAHKERNCIWDECKAVLEGKRDTPEHVRQVQKRLKDIDMPKDWGLFDTNIVLKLNKNKELQLISEEILHWITTDSTRDQLSLTYVYYKIGFDHFEVFPLGEAFIKSGQHVRIKAF